MNMCNQLAWNYTTSLLAYSVNQLWKHDLVSHTGRKYRVQDFSTRWVCISSGIAHLSCTLLLANRNKWNLLYKLKQLFGRPGFVIVMQHNIHKTTQWQAEEEKWQDNEDIIWCTRLLTLIQNPKFGLQ